MGTDINDVIGNCMKETEIGVPVTDHMYKIIKGEYPFYVHDTRGFELEQDLQKKLRNELMKTINKSRKKMERKNIRKASPSKATQWLRQS